MAKIKTLGKSPYHSARISVSRGFLYEPELIESLIDKSFDEILKYMEETQFKEAIDKSFIQYEGFYLIEKVLNEYLSKIYEKLIHTAPRGNKVLLEEYYLKYQIHNLMVLIRCRLGNEKNITPYLIGDKRKQDKFLKAMDMQNLEDAISYIAQKLKFDTNEVLKKYEEGVYELENYLYKLYYDRITSYKFKYNNRDEKEFVKFIRRYIDLINARSLAKLKTAETEKIRFEEVFITGGNLDMKFFESLITLEMDKYLSKIKDTFSDMVGLDDFSSVTQIDKAISSHKAQASKKIFKKANFGSPFYAFKYLFELERQISRLRLLLKAKYLNMEKDEIRRLI